MTFGRFSFIIICVFVIEDIFLQNKNEELLLFCGKKTYHKNNIIFVVEFRNPVSIPFADE